MEIIEAKLSVNVYDENTILPISVMSAWRKMEHAEEERKAEEARKSEEERRALIDQRILASGIIAKLNTMLAKEGRFGILRANCDSYFNSYDTWDTLVLDDSWRGSDFIKGVKNKELFDWLIEHYKAAGYTIGGYGYYSASYYKNEHRLIEFPKMERRSGD